MKILFYEVRDIELDFLLENIPNNTEPYFFKNILNDNTYIDKKFFDSEALSVFVNSSLDENTLSKFKNLKFIFLRCVGYSNIDLKYCKEHNIKIFNAPNYGNSTVAEYAFSLLLNLTKKMNKAQNSIFSGDIDLNNLVGIELSSKTLGVIGVGAIGRKVINIAHGFNMKVLAYDTNPLGAYNFVDFETLIKESDIITIHCPLTDSTKKLIDKTAIYKMKKNAILINTARGEIVDTEEIYKALLEKRLFGVALDVIECEEYLCQNWNKCSKNNDLKNNCLRKYFFIDKMLKLDNVIITPHIAYNTKEANERILKTTIFNIKQSFDINSGTNNLILI